MTVRFAVRLLGIVYLVSGLLGFLPFPDLNPIHADGIGVRYLMNIAAVNPAHNAIHIILGLTALWSARTPVRARLWAIAAGSALVTLSVAGMIQAVLTSFPVDHMLFGIVAVNLPADLFHLVTGCTALFIGLSGGAVVHHAGSPR
jgi:Domain of unknown function (DUF4383)